MKDTDQDYINTWNAPEQPSTSIVIEASGADAGTDPASVASMASQAAVQLAQVAEAAGNEAAAQSAAEYSSSWARH